MMRVTELHDAQFRERRIAVGEFDGVHLGHLAVIDGCDSVLTFEPHPRAVVGPTGAPPLLTTLAQKIDALAAIGVDELVVANFDEAFSQMEADAFITDILIERLGATEVSVGQNFRFGRKARGDAELLLSDTRFVARIADIVESEHGVISSSRIRDLVKAGDLESAAALLGRPFEMRGTVVHGEKRGRELGYPTANIKPDPICVIPPTGIYACTSNSLPAVASLGVRPTFEAEGELLLEVHLLDFSGDLYGQELKVELLQRLRGELKFDGIEPLIKQMKLDSEQAAAVCQSHAG